MHAIIRNPHLKPSPTHQDARNQNVLPLVSQNEQIAGLFSDISHLICILVHSDGVALSNKQAKHTILTIHQAASHCAQGQKHPKIPNPRKKTVTHAQNPPRGFLFSTFEIMNTSESSALILSGNTSPLPPKRMILSCWHSLQLQGTYHNTNLRLHKK